MTDAINNDQTSTDAAAPVVAKKPQLFKKLAQFQTPDGTIFETQKEAAEHVRKYLVVEAIAAVAESFNPEAGTLADFLMANKDAVLKAYDAAKVERAPVTEETKAKMKAARAKLQEGRALAPVADEAPAQ